MRYMIEKRDFFNGLNILLRLILSHLCKYDDGLLKNPSNVR